MPSKPSALKKQTAKQRQSKTIKQRTQDEPKQGKANFKRTKTVQNRPPRTNMDRKQTQQGTNLKRAQNTQRESKSSRREVKEHNEPTTTPTCFKKNPNRLKKNRKRNQTAQHAPNYQKLQHTHKLTLQSEATNDTKINREWCQQSRWSFSDLSPHPRIWNASPIIMFVLRALGTSKSAGNCKPPI